MTHEEILQQLYDDTLVGKKPEVEANVNLGLEDGLEPERMLFDAVRDAESRLEEELRYIQERFEGGPPRL